MSSNAMHDGDEINDERCPGRPGRAHCSCNFGSQHPLPPWSWFLSFPSLPPVARPEGASSLRSGFNRYQFLFKLAVSGSSG